MIESSNECDFTLGESSNECDFILDENSGECDFMLGESSDECDFTLGESNDECDFTFGDGEEIRKLYSIALQIKKLLETRGVRMTENDLRNTFIDLTRHRFKLYLGNHFHFPRK